jgi:phosphoenolpyruvate carboxylase
MPSENLLQRVFDKIDADYDFLLDSLEEVLRSTGEGDLAACLPHVRVRNGGDRPAVDPRREIQVLSCAFQLLNLVEENAAAQIRRIQETQQGPEREPGLWAHSLAQLRECGISGEQIAGALRDIAVEPVLTAHPTESKRPTVLRIHRALYLMLVALENTMWTPAEREDIHAQIRTALERLWRTGEIYLEKPTVESERDNLLYYLGTVFPTVLARLDARLRQAWKRAGLDPALIDSPEKMPPLSFGSWVGGDRDGHPLVTPEVTRETLQRMRTAGLTMLREHLVQMAERLSLTDEHQEPPAILLEGIDRLAHRWGVAAGPTREPWNRFAELLIIGINRAFSGSNGYRNGGELAADLVVLRESLNAIGADRLAASDVAPVERLVRVFGFQLASLDVRQNSAFHDRALGQLLAAAGFEDTDFAGWPEEKRLAFLERELASPRPFVPSRAKLGAEAESVLGCYRVLAEHIDRTDGEGLGSLIISMTRSMSDLLVVYLLAREVGLAWHDDDGLVCALPVVPLFETVDDLARSPEILRRFVEHPVTRRTLGHRGGRRIQQVMVGYSDSNKDGGILSAQWRIHQAQKALAEAGREAGVEVMIFHGRGGTTSRGAGPTHRFLDAMPKGSLGGLFRLTEQGETIAQKYANQITATYNLELLQAGVTATTLKHRAGKGNGEEEFAEVMESLALLSQEAYEAILRSERFIEFWEQATPIDALETSTIGSRPARRTGQRSMEDLRAIPWVFSWNQARYYLPGWYGLGSGLARLRDQDPEGFRLLAEKGTKWSFLRYVLYNAETSLASASLELMRDYAQLVEDTELRNRVYLAITDEHRLTQAMIDDLFHAPRDQRRPRMIKTLRLRDAGLRRLHKHQIRLLREWRAAREAGDEGREAQLHPTVLLSINAIASGLRTTG